MQSPILENIVGMRNATPVDVVQAGALTGKIFRSKYVMNSRPCVIKNAVTHWAACSRWGDKEYLKKCCGGHRVQFYPHENYSSLRKMHRQGVNVSFAEAIERLHAPTTKVASVRPDALPELHADLGDFSFLPRRPSPIFFSPIRYFFYKNAGTTWHYHPFDETLMCQIVGSKKVGLLDVRSRQFLRLQQFFAREEYYRHVCADEPTDPAMRWLLAVVEEGDALYIPPSYWHGVVAGDARVGITLPVCWRSPLHIIGDFSSPAVRLWWRKGAEKRFRRKTITRYAYLSVSAVVAAICKIARATVGRRAERSGP